MRLCMKYVGNRRKRLNQSLYALRNIFSLLMTELWLNKSRAF